MQWRGLDGIRLDWMALVMRCDTMWLYGIVLDRLGWDGNGDGNGDGMGWVWRVCTDTA